MPCYDAAMLGDDKPLRELDDTAASAANDRLDEIIKKIKAAGGMVESDDEAPLMIEFNLEIVPVGFVRKIRFNLNKMDYEITRQIKHMKVGGAGHKKHLENLTRPMIETKLKKKPELSDQWTGVDFEDMF